MVSLSIPLKSSPVRFGTDGWRGVLGVDITIERLMSVAAAASQELLFRAPAGLNSRLVLIGYDRRFLAPELAEAITAAVRGCELEPLLAKTPLPTPACSWAVVEKRALGALIITASHNPPEWLGLKVKGPFGGSVEGGFTEAVERRMAAGAVSVPIESPVEKLDFRKDHLDGLRNKVDLFEIVKGLNEMGLKVIVDPMHGSASGCLSELFGEFDLHLVKEIRTKRDPLFGGHPPEPLEPYLGELVKEVKACSALEKPALGLVFDGDGDRIAAVDEEGRFCSTQLLIPLLIDHLGRVKGLPGSVVKTVSGSDLMQFVAEDLGREVVELPVGFKHIAAEMLSGQVLVGGEESGGVGFGMHLPERDALFAALLLLEALAESKQSLGARLKSLQAQFGRESFYDRIDIKLKDMETRIRIEKFLSQTSDFNVLGRKVIEVIRTDGVKLRFGPGYWLMLRFSGTEPLLRIYCEAPTKEVLSATLIWAKELTTLK